MPAASSFLAALSAMAAAAAPAARPANPHTTHRCRAVTRLRPESRHLCGSSGSSLDWLPATEACIGRRVRCRGFVGDGTQPAAQYHSADFAWEEVAELGVATVERQRRELRQHLLQQQGQEEGVRWHSRQQAAVVATGLAEAARCSVGEEGSWASSSSSGSSGYESDDSWERFHAQHSQARFFKEKR